MQIKAKKIYVPLTGVTKFPSQEKKRGKNKDISVTKV
jgi:hypothetical protein